MIEVTALSITAVKGTRLLSVPEILLGTDGAEGNRRFFVIDERDRMVNAKTLGELQTVIARYVCENGDRRLALEFPDGAVVEDLVREGPAIETSFFSRKHPARPVEGPWSAALSEHLGRPLRLVEANGAGAGVDRGRAGAVTLISRASLARLAAQAGEPSVDPRRFRMLVEIDGLEPHAEDAWIDRTARIGEATISFTGHVGRCLITSRDPESGVIDLPTLDIIRGYRVDSNTTEPLPFGIYGEVVSGGLVRVGDEVAAS